MSDTQKRTRRPSVEGREAPEKRLVRRVREQGERVHIPVGDRCNNHCLFCMEDDREARARVNAAMTGERIRGIIARHREAEELCFTSGEPTLHPRLPEFIRWCRASGVRQVSLMTNGRRLAYAPYAEALVQAGLTKVYVSIHGHHAALHDGLTRTPGSFDQTVAGLRVAASLRRRGLALHTSTVVTRRNVSALTEIYEMLAGLGVQQVVFNALQMNGGAAKHFDSLVPRYMEVRSRIERLLKDSRDGGRRAFVVDVPPCITEGLPDRNRGFVEQRVHYEVVFSDIAPRAGAVSEQDRDVWSVSTQDLDAAFRTLGPSCSMCRYRPICAGVYQRYVDAFGWVEFQPVRATDERR